MAAEAERDAERGKVRRLQEELEQATRKISQLELEAASAKEDASRRVREVEEATSIERIQVERQHADDISRLKESHMKELDAMRQRFGEAKQLDTLTAQLETSLGSLKLLETQLSERKHGIELTRQSQLDARERLIQELEANAEALHSKNEKEVARLQGLLHAMDQVSRNMRSGQLHEAERLRVEHERIQEQQQAIVASQIAERDALSAEKKELHERQTSFNTERREKEKALAAERDRLNSLQEKLDRDRDILAEQQVAALRELDQRELRVKEKEAAVAELSAALQRGAQDLDAQAVAAQKDLVASEQARSELQLRMEKLDADKRKIAETAMHLEEMSRAVADKEMKADAKLQQATRLFEEASVARIESENHRRAVEGATLQVQKDRVSLQDLRQEVSRREFAVSESEKRVHRMEKELKLKYGFSRPPEDHRSRALPLSEEQALPESPRAQPQPRGDPVVQRQVFLRTRGASYPDLWSTRPPVSPFEGELRNLLREENGTRVFIEHQKQFLRDTGALV